jgi:hypothetical protein
MDTVLVCNVDPDAGVNVKSTPVIARVGSKPTTTTVNPDPPGVAVTLVIVGAAAPIVMVRVGAGEGVISVPSATNCCVMVMTPATVPV